MASKHKFTKMSTRKCTVDGCPKHIKLNVVEREQVPVDKCYFHIQVHKAATGRSHRNFDALNDPIKGMAVVEAKTKPAVA